MAGESPTFDRFIATIDALGQIWIAALLLFLAYEELSFSKRASERQSRDVNFDRRFDLQKRWSQFGKQIGYTAFNEKNFDKLASLPTEIKAVFGREVATLARQAIKAAREARNRAEIVVKEEGALQQVELYRNAIAQYRDSHQEVWHSMADKLTLDV